MIEEFVQGESLDTFVLHQNYISQELILKFGIQLCDILEYLHTFMPYPILYQDLKPEHIILCGDHLKLVDFGIASFFTGSYNDFHFYGTKEFAAPEVLSGTAVTPLSDLYSLGKLLLFLLKNGNTDCSDSLLSVIQKACAKLPSDRYETVTDFKMALMPMTNPACPFVSHLCKKITVFGSKHGIGTTHIAVSLVSFLNQNGIASVYLEHNHSDCLRSMMRIDRSVKEENGLCSYKFFQGIPDYGPGIEVALPRDCLIVEDLGIYTDHPVCLDPDSLVLCIISGSTWDTEQILQLENRLRTMENLIFICNYGNRSAARRLAGLLNRKVFCFPADNSAFINTSEKEKLFFSILPLERSKRKFLPFIQKHPKNI